MTVKKLLGNQPGQVSRNRDLGTIAFQNANGGSVDNLGGYLSGQIGLTGKLKPNTRPGFICDFVSTPKLNGQIKFERNTIGYYYSGQELISAMNVLYYSQDLQYMSNTSNNQNKEGHYRWEFGGINFWGSGSTANATTAPDGTTTADLITETSTTENHGIWQYCFGWGDYWPEIDKTWCFSVYVKNYSSNRYVRLILTYDSYSYGCITVNPTDGTIIQQPIQRGNSYGTLLIGGNIVSVGSGWYRVHITANLKPQYCFIMLSNSTSNWLSDDYGRNTYTGNGTSGVYLWGAQLECDTDTPRPYTYTFDLTVLEWQPVLTMADLHEPRFECNPITNERQGLLIERGSWNYLQESHNFHKSPWTKTNCSIIDPYTNRLLITGTVMNPDGSWTHNYLQEDGTASAAHSISQTISGLSDGYFQTFSVYAKAKERTFIRLSSVCTRQTVNVWFDIANGLVGTEICTVTSTTYNNYLQRYRASIENVGNGWYRCAILFNTHGGTTATVSIALATGDNVSTYSGTSVAGCYLWGAQFEQIYHGAARENPLASSYIPTTFRRQYRSPDRVVIRGLNTPERGQWFNQIEGTFIGEFARSNDIYADYISVMGMRYDQTQGTYDSGTFIRLYRYANQIYINASGQQQYWDGKADTSAFDNYSQTKWETYHINHQKIHKIGFSFSLNNVSFCANGDQPTVGRKWQPKTFLNTIWLGTWSGGPNESQNLNGYLRRFMYYPKKVTDDELQALTFVDNRDGL